MKTASIQTTPKQSVYETVTAQIVAAIEAGGVGKWSRPWHTTGLDVMSPINVVSRRAYRGINTLCLWTAASKKGYTSGEWGTYKQWAAKGAQVRKGEKATMIVFWKFASTAKGEAEPTDDGVGIGGKSRLVFTRGYFVFNAAQVDGYTPAEVAEVPVEERHAAADEFFARVGAKNFTGGNQAFYRPSEDQITMPAFSAFDEPVDYYSTWAHEHTHWTGPKSRCDRDLSGRFGSSAYAMEELVAELGAAFLCAKLGLSSTPRPDHAEYVQNWLAVLKGDSRAIFTAASKAQIAADYLAERGGLLETEADEADEAEAA